MSADDVGENAAAFNVGNQNDGGLPVARANPMLAMSGGGRFFSTGEPAPSTTITS